MCIRSRMTCYVHIMYVPYNIVERMGRQPETRRAIRQIPYSDFTFTIFNIGVVDFFTTLINAESR